VRSIAITGSASGIGLATKRRLEEESVRVIGVDRADADVIADLSTRAGRNAALKGIREASGGVLDGFIGYAGVGPTVGDIALLTSVNYFGQMELLTGLKPMLAAGHSSAVVIVSSVAPLIAAVDDASVAAMIDGDEQRAIALTVKHGDRSAAYSSAKLAVLRAGRKLAVDWIAEGIRINVLAPGNTATPMMDDALADPTFGEIMRSVPVPIGAWANPEDIAEAACWLLSASSRYVVGSVLVVDGGTDALLRPESA
jgi:NAD(P)-dependent dehydrogenase (short-subunit alcohol dehydrogenase family)